MRKDITPIRPVANEGQNIDSESDQITPPAPYPIQLKTTNWNILAEQRVQTIKKESNPIQLTPGKLLRLNQFIPDIYPICKSKWWDGVKKGIYPAPIKLGPRTTAWRSDDLIALIENGVYRLRR